MKIPLFYPLLIAGKLVVSCGSGNQTAHETRITRVYESDDSHSILYDTGSSQGNLLVTDPGSHFIILYQTTCNEWLTAEKSPAQPVGGRVETTHLLFYIPERRQIDIESLHPALSSYGIWFEEENGNFFLVEFLKGSAETEDIAAIIEEGGPRSGRFSNLAGLTVDHHGYLHIHDRRRNGGGEIYTFRREGNNLKWIITEQYPQVPSPSGNIYEASVIDDTYRITRDDGNYVFRNRTPMGIVSASVMAIDNEGNIYLYCEEVGGQIAGPYTLKVAAPLPGGWW